MVNVLITRKFFSQDLNYIKARLDQNVNLIEPNDFSEEELIKQCKNVEIFLGNFFSRNLLKEANQLKFIQIPWTGVDNLDFSILLEFNVELYNSHSNSTAVAEHAVAMMFDIAKKLSYHDRLLRIGDWNRPSEENANTINSFSKNISNSNIAILGYGAIGKKIHKFLNQYNCKFNIIDASIPENKKKKNAQYFSETKLIEAVKNSDFVFIALPLTKSTKGLINDGFFKSMSKNSVLINISRGEVINEKDLYDALKNNIIYGAAIDTWYQYPSKNNRFVFPSESFSFHNLDNLLLSSHRAGFIEGALPHLDDAIENINNYINNIPLINKVSLKNKY